MTKDWDEALLVAYVDQELDPDGVRRAERAIAADPAARALVDVLRRSAEAARGAFAEPLGAPPPRRLVEAIVRRRPTGRPRAWRPLALAASVAALVVGFGGGYLYRGAAAPGYNLAGGPTAPSSGAFEAALARLLEQDAERASATYPTADGEGRVTLLGPVATEHGLSCRAFESGAPGAAAAGLACRDNGGWSVLVVPGGGADRP